MSPSHGERSSVGSSSGKSPSNKSPSNKSPSHHKSVTVLAEGVPTHHAGATRVGAFENRSYTKAEHEEWAAKLWRRIDRDESGSVTREELNCEEFQDVLRAVIAPETAGEAHATYARAEIHIEQALDFCLRKTHVNGDGSLSFKEFKSFMKILRDQDNAHSRVQLIWSLFDLDGSNTIDKEEFVGIYSFFSGHQPTKPEVEEAFRLMDKLDKKEITQKQFTWWIENAAPAAFRQHSHAIEHDGESTASSTSRVSNKVKIHRPAPGLFKPLSTKQAEETWTNTWKSHWNERWRGRDHTLMNPTLTPGLKHYFSAPQTLPELDRFYSTYQGFGKHRKRLHEPLPERPRPILSQQAKTLDVNVERALPGGTSRNAKGALVLWDNEWPDKASDFKMKPWPGSLMLRCPGKPPPLLLLGRDAEHQAYRAQLTASYGDLVTPERNCGF